MDIVDLGGNQFSGFVTMNGMIRLTDTNCVAPGPCTLIDVPFPVQVPCGNVVPHSHGGKCSVKTTLNTVLSGAITPGSVVAITDVTLLDPDANPFAVQGVFVP